MCITHGAKVCPGAFCVALKVLKKDSTIFSSVSCFFVDEHISKPYLVYTL